MDGSENTKTPTNTRTELKLDELSAILKACQATGVAEITYGPLHAKFFGAGKPADNAPQVPKVVQPTPEELALAEEDERKAIAHQELELKEDFVADLQASDPELYEALVAAGELVDGGPEVRRPGSEVEAG